MRYSDEVLAPRRWQGRPQAHEAGPAGLVVGEADVEWIQARHSDRVHAARRRGGKVDQTWDEKGGAMRMKLNKEKWRKQKQEQEVKAARRANAEAARRSAAAAARRPLAHADYESQASTDHWGYRSD
jgi:hypothetical protein